MESRPPPRPHHLKFKYALVQVALTDAARFVDLCGNQTELVGAWDAVGAELAEGDRLSPDGLSAQNVGDAERPVIMIALPAPERPNEAYYLCAVPRSASLDPDGSLFVPSGPLELRVFGMERSILPDGGLIGFVVEWTTVYRHNYDAPENASAGAFWKAILEVFAGTRVPIHSMALQTA